MLFTANIGGLDQGWRFYTDQIIMKSSGQTLGEGETAGPSLPVLEVKGEDPAAPVVAATDWGEEIARL
jgi:hypothetical protein